MSDVEPLLPLMRNELVRLSLSTLVPLEFELFCTTPCAKLISWSGLRTLRGDILDELAFDDVAAIGTIRDEFRGGGFDDEIRCDLGGLKLDGDGAFLADFDADACDGGEGEAGGFRHKLVIAGLDRGHNEAAIAGRLCGPADVGLQIGKSEFRVGEGSVAGVGDKARDGAGLGGCAGGEDEQESEGFRHELRVLTVRAGCCGGFGSGLA